MKLWSPFADENINDPYPMYERIRSEGPIFKTQTNEYIFTNYDDISNILKNKEDFLVGNGKVWLEHGVTYLKTKDIDLAAINEAINSFILLLNPPNHQQVRKFVAQTWNEREVQEIIEENCDELINNIGDSKFDFISSFAAPLPAMTIAKILGIETADYYQLQRLGSQMVKSLDFYLKIEDLIKIDAAAKAFIAFFKKHISNPPTHGLLKKLIENNAKMSDPLTESELISIGIFLFVAGEETTVSLLSTGLLNLINLGLWKELNDENVHLYVEELLRFDGPVHLLGRITAKDVTFGQTTIKKNSPITLCLAAANRDPSKFNNADTFNIHRTTKHLAFGNGAHYCLGDWLAREQANIAFRKLKSRFPQLALTDEKLEWKSQLAIRRLMRLNVSV